MALSARIISSSDTQEQHVPLSGLLALIPCLLQWVKFSYFIVNLRSPLLNLLVRLVLVETFVSLRNSQYNTLRYDTVLQQASTMCWLTSPWNAQIASSLRPLCYSMMYNLKVHSLYIGTLKRLCNVLKAVSII